MTGVPGGHERAILAEGGQPPGPPEAAPGGPALTDDPPRSATEVLADRIAVALAHHEPGWRLPRYSALARRYHVSTAEIDAAVDELATRRLIRRLPDGQLYRASPAEYLIPLEGVGGLVSHVDPMGAELTCRSRQVSWRRVPEDIRWALRIPPSEEVCVVRLAWTANGEPAAFTVTYLPKDMAGPFAGDDPARGGPTKEEIGDAAGLNVLPLTAAPAGPGEGHAGLVPAGRPAALHVEMQPPPASLARNLRLSAGQPAAMVAVRFDDPEAARPVALTVAAVRPDLFRIVVETGESPFPRGGEGGFPGGWAQAVEDWKS
ncbi:MAG TPA: UTRA domain-containing protein [Streptosporangiaceae bacterium]|nr:UTRA domain-containing protein [Streptosporangiaceae bacterium]